MRTQQKVILWTIAACTLAAGAIWFAGPEFRPVGLLVDAVFLSAAVGAGYALIHVTREPGYKPAERALPEPQRALEPVVRTAVQVFHELEAAKVRS